MVSQHGGFDRQAAMRTLEVLELGSHGVLGYRDDIGHDVATGRDDGGADRVRHGAMGASRQRVSNEPAIFRGHERPDGNEVQRGWHEVVGMRRRLHERGSGERSAVIESR